MTKIIFDIKGMYCNSCAVLIEKELKDKVKSVKASYANENAEIEFDEGKISEDEIIENITSLGFEVVKEKPQNKKNEINKKEISEAEEYYTINKAGLTFFLCAAAIIILLFVYLIKGSGFSIFNVQFPSIGEKTSLILLFIAGILTGFHCISMCGAFVVSYTTKNALNGHKSFKQHLVYGSSKVLSYALIGGTFGLIGGFFSFSTKFRGTIAILAGIVMIFYALSMFGIKFFKRFQFNPKFLARAVSKTPKGPYTGPFFTGLLNGLFIACGPLQAMYLYAAGTGNFIAGMTSLAAFGLGTLPVMLGFGSLATVISHKTTAKILKFSAVIVLVLGLVMLNRGLTLTGTGYDFNTLATSVRASGNSATGAAVSDQATTKDGYQEIRMDVTRYGWEPNKFVLKKGVPVRWTINGKEINSCNNAIQIPKLGLKFDIKPGEQIIEFTPTQEGVIPWSCWMGMIQGTFIIKENVDLSNTAAIQKELNSVTVPKGGSCGGSGGCGCGGTR